MPFVSYSPNHLDWILFRLLNQDEGGCYVALDDGEAAQDCITHAFYDHGWIGSRISCSEQIQQEKIPVFSREKHFLIDELGAANALELQTFAGNNSVIHLWSVSSPVSLEQTVGLLKETLLRPWVIALKNVSSLDGQSVSESTIAVLKDLGYQQICMGDYAQIFIASEHTQLVNNLENIGSFFNRPFVSREVIRLRIQLKEAHHLQEVNQNTIARHFNQILETQAQFNELQAQSNQLQAHTTQLQHQHNELQNERNHLQAHCNELHTQINELDTRFNMVQGQLHIALMQINDPLIAHKPFKQIIKALVKRVLNKLGRIANKNGPAQQAIEPDSAEKTNSQSEQNQVCAQSSSEAVSPLKQSDSQ